MYDVPYVRNAPLLAVRAGLGSDGFELVGGHLAIGLSTSGQAGLADLESTARHLATAWNLHDPLVDALRDLAETSHDDAAIRQARLVLAAVPAGARQSAVETTVESEEPAPWLPRSQPSPEQLALRRAQSHLSEGLRLTCLAAPQYSLGGHDELMKAQELLVELATLLGAQ